MATQNRLVGILVGVLGILLIPFIAMQFSDQVNWTLGDFIVAGGLLFSTGLMCELAIRKIKTRQQRILACIAILAMLLLVWAELAVGILGTPFAGS